MTYEYISGIGQDSHRFCQENDPDFAKRKLTLGGVVIPDAPPLAGNSDADVLLHALTNAITGLTGRVVLGDIADRLCLEEGITDSKEYLKVALSCLDKWQLRHISFTLEAAKPKLLPWIKSIRHSIALLTGLTDENVTITATTGEGLTDFGRGLGIQAFCLVTARKKSLD